ncbi:MAG TPA: hypothetical protein VMF58_16710 [Rhizomicrobium sp.]|nr:hypothetical protein [Rhizomicrobium sp.]
MTYEPTVLQMMSQSEAAQLRERIHEISVTTRLTLADAARRVRAEISRRNADRDDTLQKVAEALEHLAYGEA